MHMAGYYDAAGAGGGGGSGGWQVDASGFGMAGGDGSGGAAYAPHLPDGGQAGSGTGRLAALLAPEDAVALSAVSGLGFDVGAADAFHDTPDLGLGIGGGGSDGGAAFSMSGVLRAASELQGYATHGAPLGGGSLLGLLSSTSDATTSGSLMLPGVLSGGCGSSLPMGAAHPAQPSGSCDSNTLSTLSPVTATSASPLSADGGALPLRHAPDCAFPLIHAPAGVLPSIS